MLQVLRDRPAQLVAVEIQLLELGQPGQFGGDRPAQLVAAERQPLELGQPGQFGRDRPAQLVAAEIQRLKLGQPAQRRRDRPAQLVAPERQVLRARPVRAGSPRSAIGSPPSGSAPRDAQFAGGIAPLSWLPQRDSPFGGDWSWVRAGSAQLVAAAIGVGSARPVRGGSPRSAGCPRETAIGVGSARPVRAGSPRSAGCPRDSAIGVGSAAGQFGGDRPAQLVAPTVVPDSGSACGIAPLSWLPLELGQPGQFGGDRPAQLVAAEIQRLELGQPAQFGAGIAPLSWLDSPSPRSWMLRTRDRRQVSLNWKVAMPVSPHTSSGGIAPLSWLPLRSSDWSWVSPASSGGITPLSWLPRDSAIGVGSARPVRGGSPRSAGCSSIGVGSARQFGGDQPRSAGCR